MAVAAGPIIGGAVTTFASWRYVFVGEVIIVLTILPVLRKVEDDPPARVRLDYWGSALSIVGLGMIVYGVLRSGEWGWVQPKPGAPTVLGLSPAVWLLIGGLSVFFAQFLIQAGVFFTIPLFLSVVLERWGHCRPSWGPSRFPRCRTRRARRSAGSRTRPPTSGLPGDRPDRVGPHCHVERLVHGPVLARCAGRQC